jgi:hypothetical protein
MPNTSIGGKIVDVETKIDTAIVNIATLDGKVVVVDGVVDSILATMALPKIARKIYTFSATPISTIPIFTVTGAVKVKLYAICTTGLTPAVAGATVSLGIVGTVAQFIAATLAADFAAGEIWFDATPTTVVELDSAVSAGIMAKTVIGDGADIVIDVAVQAITSGVIEFLVEWEPITTDGNVVAV